MFIERFRLGKGIERNGKKEYIELECRMPESSTDKTFASEFAAAEYIIDGLFENVPGATNQQPAAAPHAPKMLMSLEEIDAEPWKASAWIRKDDKDRVARTGEDAYLPRMAANKKLLEMINAAPNHKLNLPPYDFSYGGTDGGLVIRKVLNPVKAK